MRRMLSSPPTLPIHFWVSAPSTVKHKKKENENTMRFVLFLGYAENWVLSWKKAISHFVCDFFYFRRFCFVCPRALQSVCMLLSWKARATHWSLVLPAIERAELNRLLSVHFFFSPVDSFIQSIFNIAFVKECVIFGANIIFSKLCSVHIRKTLLWTELLLCSGERIMHAWCML